MENKSLHKIYMIQPEDLEKNSLICITFLLPLFYGENRYLCILNKRQIQDISFFTFSFITFGVFQSF